MTLPLDELTPRRHARQLDRLAVLARLARPDDPGSWAADLLNRDDTMPEKWRAVRVPDELLSRCEALAPRVRDAAGPLGAAVKVSGAAIVRLALERGLDLLEAEFDAGEEENSQK